MPTSMPRRKGPPRPDTSLRDLRERRQLTQVELAVRAGLSLNTVGAAERHGIVSPASAEKIARALGCGVKALLARMRSAEP
jgi:transcriptional regulator with XRE-family HTH domain